MDELISNFCAITAASTDKAERYLQVCDNDLERAVTLFLENDGADLGGAEPSAPATDDSDALARRLQEEEYASNGGEVREAIQRRTDTLVGGDDDDGFGGWQNDYLPQAAPGAYRGTGSRPAGIFSQRLRPADEDEDDMIIIDSDEDEEDDDPYEASIRRQRAAVDTGVAPSRMTAHQTRLAKLFQPPFDIMKTLGFEDARRFAREQTKWLLVNIHDPTDFRCQVLNRDFWSDKAVKDVVRENFVFVQYESDSPDGQYYTNLYPFDDFPHVAILDPRTGEQVKTWSKALVPADWMQDVYEFLSRYSLEKGHKNPIKTKTSKPVSRMTEEEQMDYVVRKSLGHEVEDEVEVDVDGKGKAKEEEEPPAADGEETDEDRFLAIVPDAPEEPPNEPDTTRIQLRLADGSRVVRRIRTTDPVRAIYAFVKTLDKVQGTYFELTSAREKLFAKLDETVEAAGLKNASILVEVLD
ncbi:UBX domain-containing protein 2 [Yarrowia sp. B02]|nr:UBX domain-containing protein 2 [Yarrowia sp. B02]